MSTSKKSFRPNLNCPWCDSPGQKQRVQVLLEWVQLGNILVAKCTRERCDYEESHTRSAVIDMIITEALEKKKSQPPPAKAGGLDEKA